MHRRTTIAIIRLWQRNPCCCAVIIIHSFILKAFCRLRRVLRGAARDFGTGLSGVTDVWRGWGRGAGGLSWVWWVDYLIRLGWGDEGGRGGAAGHTRTTVFLFTDSVIATNGLHFRFCDRHNGL